MSCLYCLLNHEVQANNAVMTIFSKLYADLKLVLEGVKFVEGDKGKDTFEVDGLLVASKAVVVVEAKIALRESHVDQVINTAGNITKYWSNVKLKAPDAGWPRIEECELIRVLVAPYASPQVIAAVAGRTEKFVVITDSGDALQVTYTSPELRNLASG